MNDVKCPYCGTEQEINHDDGYGYQEDEEYTQSCVNCDEEFLFRTSISFKYDVMCRDGDHKMVPFGDKWPGMYECERCDFYELRKEEK